MKVSLTAASRSLFRLTSLALLVAAAPRSAHAVPVSFTIDPARSTYHIVNVQADPAPTSPLQDSTILGVPVIPQVAGADTDALTGTISGDLTGGSLTFNGSSSIVLAANAAGPFAPATNPGTENFGIVTNAATPAGVISVAIRDWAFTLQSGTASDGLSPNVGAIVLAATTGYQQNSVTGQASLVGQTGADVSTLPISLTTAGGIETLVIPVVRLPAAGTPGQIYFEGTITATRPVPEPSTLALAALASAGLVIVRRRTGSHYGAQVERLLRRQGSGF